MLILLFVLLSFAAAAAVYAGGHAAGAALLAFAVCFVLLHLLCLLFWWLVSLTVDNTKPIEKQSRLCRVGCVFFASAICTYGGIKAEIIGAEKLPKDGRFLFVCNHRSMFDPLIVIDRLRACNISFISKPSNMKLPIVGRLSYGAGFLPIDRENDRNALKTILTAAGYLTKDICSVGIYPEGTRNKGDELLPFHPGSFKIAQRANVPVAVASIRYGKRSLLGGTPARLTVIEVIPAQTVKDMKTQDLAAYVRDEIKGEMK